MNLGGRRILIGFDSSKAVAKLEDDDLILDDGTEVVMGNSITIPSAFATNGGDVVSEINRHKAEDTILESVITASHIGDGEISPAMFDKSSDPLDVSRGGTGLSNIPLNALLVGGGESPASHTHQVSFDNDTLTTSSLTVGTWTYAASNNIHGRSTLAAIDSVSGSNVDLLHPRKNELTEPSLVLSPLSGQITMEVLVSDPLVRLVHFDWRVSPSDDLTPAQIAYSSRKSVAVGPDRLATYTATGLSSGIDHDFRAVTEDGRGNVSMVTKAMSAAL